MSVFPIERYRSVFGQKRLTDPEFVVSNPATFDHAWESQSVHKHKSPFRHTLSSDTFFQILWDIYQHQSIGSGAICFLSLKSMLWKLNSKAEGLVYNRPEELNPASSSLLHSMTRLAAHLLLSASIMLIHLEIHDVITHLCAFSNADALAVRQLFWFGQCTRCATTDLHYDEEGHPRQLFWCQSIFPAHRSDWGWITRQTNQELAVKSWILKSGTTGRLRCWIAAWIIGP